MRPMLSLDLSRLTISASAYELPRWRGCEASNLVLRRGTTARRMLNVISLPNSLFTRGCARESVLSRSPVAWCSGGTSAWRNNLFPLLFRHWPVRFEYTCAASTPMCTFAHLGLRVVQLYPFTFTPIGSCLVGRHGGKGVRGRQGARKSNRWTYGHACVGRLSTWAASFSPSSLWARIPRASTR